MIVRDGPTEYRIEFDWLSQEEIRTRDIQGYAPYGDVVKPLIRRVPCAATRVNGKVQYQYAQVVTWPTRALQCTLSLVEGYDEIGSKDGRTIRVPALDVLSGAVAYEPVNKNLSRDAMRKMALAEALTRSFPGLERKRLRTLFWTTYLGRKPERPWASVGTRQIVIHVPETYEFWVDDAESRAGALYVNLTHQNDKPQEDDDDDDN